MIPPLVGLLYTKAERRKFFHKGRSNVICIACRAVHFKQLESLLHCIINIAVIHSYIIHLIMNVKNPPHNVEDPILKLQLSDQVDKYGECNLTDLE